MIKEITVGIIQETGYTSWGEFLISIQQTIFRKEGTIIGYLNPQGEMRNISLELSQTMIERLALEEGKIILPVLKIDSFVDFKAKIEEENKIYDKLYTTDVIVRDINSQILLKQISLPVSLIERLAIIEKSETNYLVHYEVKKCN